MRNLGSTRKVKTMSTEKMILIRSLGFAVPQSAILSLAICRKEEKNYEMPQDSVEANPTVVFSRTMAYYLSLSLDAKYIPVFDSEEAVEPEEVEEQPKRRGRKPNVTAVAPPVEPQKAGYMIHIHSDELDTPVETTLAQSDALRNYVTQSDKKYEKVRVNLGRLSTFVHQMNSAIENITSMPEMPALSGLIPGDLQFDMNRHSQAGIEIHADQMRKEQEKARDNYDRVIEWFRRFVLVPEIGEAELVNITSDIPHSAAARDSEGTTSLTIKKLLDLVKDELTVLF